MITTINPVGIYHQQVIRAPQAETGMKNSPANAGDIRNMGLVPGLGRSPGTGNDNPLQYSHLENPMDRGAWQAIVQRVPKSQIPLKQLSMHQQT